MCDKGSNDSKDRHRKSVLSVKQRWRFVAKYGQISKIFHFASKWNETPSRAPSEWHCVRRRKSTVNSSHHILVQTKKNWPTSIIMRYICEY